MNAFKKYPLLLSLVLVVGFASGIAFLAVMGSAAHTHTAEASLPPALTVSPQGKALLNEFSTAFEAAAAKVNQAVVPITSEQVTTVQNPFGSQDDPFRQFFGDNFFRRFFGSPNQGQQKQTVRALGSGVIVTPDGYILTNNHVVDGADKLVVVLGDKRKLTAKVIGRDPQTDVAVIKVDAHDLPVATLGNSDSVRVGQWVIAVGNPFQLLHTVTAGIISAKGRSNINLAEYEDFIQTDASINPGNSGGALADLDGNVIGINTAIYSPTGSGSVGIGFAIPVNMAKSVMDQLISKGSIARGYMGIIPQDIDDNLAKALKLGTTEGSLVGDVTSGGPADNAGIERGDIIKKFNGQKVENSSQLRSLVAEVAPGSTVTVEILRDSKTMEKEVKLAERPKDLASNTPQAGPEEESSTKLGLSVENLTRDAAKQAGYTNEHGVIVTGVAAGSPAEDAGIRQGDLIKEVNKKAVRSTQDFNSAVGQLKAGDDIAFLVKRGQSTFFLATQIPG